METMVPQVLEEIKTRLRLNDAAYDGLISSYVREVGYRILHICNLDEIPNSLIGTWTSMTLAVLRVEQPQLPGLEQYDSDAIKIGDTSVSPASSSAADNTKATIDMVALSYRSDLIRHRRMRW